VTLFAALGVSVAFCSKLLVLLCLILVVPLSLSFYLQLALAKRLALFLNERHDSLFAAKYLPAATQYAGFTLLRSGGGAATEGTEEPT
jgi:transcriptional regulator of nitric oxide reductase